MEATSVVSDVNFNFYILGPERYKSEISTISQWNFSL